MRKDKKLYKLIEIVSSLPSDELDKETEMLACKCEVDWNYTALMSLAGALKVVSKGTKRFIQVIIIDCPIRKNS